MKQIYKNIYEEDGKHYYVTDDNTIPIHDVQTSILIFQVELLNKLLNKEPKVEEPEVFLKNEGKEDD